MTDNDQSDPIMPDFIRPHDLFATMPNASATMFADVFMPNRYDLVYWHFDQMVINYRQTISSLQHQFEIKPRRVGFIMFAMDYLYRMEGMMAKQDVAMLLVLIGQASVEIEQKSMHLSIMPRMMGDLLIPVGDKLSEAGFDFEMLIYNMRELSTSVIKNKEAVGRQISDDELVEQMCRVLVMRTETKPLSPADALRIAYAMGRTVAELRLEKKLTNQEAHLN